MTVLFKRAIEATVGTVLVKDLRMSFKCKRSLRSEPNTLELTIYNLSPETRSLFTTEEELAVLLEAGYEESISQLFLGTARKIRSLREGVEIKTVITAGDGERARQTSRTSQSFAAGTRVADVLKKYGEDLGLNVTTALEKLRTGEIRGGITEFVNGFVASGRSIDGLDRLLKATGLEGSVQDGELQILDKGQPSDLTAVRLDPETGLIGTPEVGKKGVVKAKSLLQPGLIPGRKAEIFSEVASIDGFYRVDIAEHVGDTHAQDWYTNIEGRPL